METESTPPTPAEATAALAGSEAGRSAFADGVVVPPLFFASLGAAVAVQIGTTATGVAAQDSAWLVVVGLAFLALVSVVQLARFRRTNGVWLGGLVSRVVGGTASTASVSYCAALAGALWAAFAGAWWLVPVCAVAGGTAYALSGVGWLRSYRSDPQTHGRGESVAWLAVVAVLAATGLVLLVVQR